ncbi:transcriptional regulator family: Fungal Specific TF [Penicillium roqueforti]|uniref:transcriptional regulator family: Fungal Specific TF n=1 Tax=Penicillium roqueforti TaxID=5082 RepID=UPI001909705D|nr:transcriptional regulator family: Fungal Specific TF [Penicillium roqueforti]KAF9250220.1 transcriptional regulator family: Fungal Specific TF [Penicillium roqueforti]KAI2676320.1 transcriptional regulator family: Fungal Specific TF [Penicillium roqueforti]KAI2679670.1 transcriptional regulator family: Fungal Specific TF [Penicillium roqueforti]KAI2700932.1 transcriptional regulator family: Fungal Specific TF [Penicillium roqueforti]KAI2717176.1 transcriptional regulator family: Fungal Spec
MLLSPWVDFRTDHPSSSENADKDVITAETLNSWARISLGQTAEDEYNCPAKAPAGWWTDLPVSKIFVGAGGDEVLLDPIRQMAEKMKAELPDVSISIVPGEFHVEPITGFALKIPPGLQFKAMASWLYQTFLSCELRKGMKMKTMHSIHDPHARPERPGDQPRKKIRKGTRSCWQCKHRKVRCIFVSDSEQSCKECLARGLPCRSQELPEPENPRESDRTYLNERMARVENLLEKLLIRVDGGNSQQGDLKSPLDLAETSLESSPSTVTPAPDSAPVLSLFDNEAIGFKRTDTVESDFTPYGTINRDWGRLRRDLTALIPSQKTLKIISEASSSWWLMRVQLFGDYDESLLSSSEQQLSNSHPAMVAKAILWIALCLQQLPSGFDLSSLDLPCLPWVLVEECITRVSTLVCSDDSIVSCIDGLECLVLQGLIFSNDGKLRSAWLSYRRAANIAQLIGFHRAEPAPNQSVEFQHRATFIWRHILIVDRHFSLILGVHGAISNTAIDLYQSNPRDSHDLPVHNESVLNPLARIAGSIIERNQTFTEVTPAMLQMTQSIDMKLQAFDPPPLVSPDNLPPGKCTERSSCFLGLHYRLWYYQLMAWLHLPLLLASGTDNSYEYNRQTCLHACRSIIACYVNIRRTTENGFDSKILDFQAFTTAMTIIVNALGPFGPQDLTKGDYFALDRVVAVLEQLSNTVPPDKIATRAVHVLKIIKAIGMGTEPPQLDESEGHQYENGRPTRIKLDIPYFGTIYLERRSMSAQSSRHIAIAVKPPPTLPNTAPGQYYPSSSWMDTMPDPGYPNGNVVETTQWADSNLSFDPPTEFWALNSEFTFQAPFLADYDVNWDYLDMGL